MNNYFLSGSMKEVCNYFIWRQRDWERNSIQMLAQSLYSHKVGNVRSGLKCRVR